MNRPSTRERIDQLNSGELTARQLTQTCLDRISALNGELNAFISVDADGALQQADDIDQRRKAGEPIGRMAGLPIGIKDNICQKNQPTTCGSRMLQNFRPPYDAHVVERLRAEDAVIVGKLNPDEFAMGSSTETSVFGPTRNPWDQTRSAGGSSGGSAVAVAAGMVPLALGSDTGGSIRQPASFCGVVGMKPTYGRVSRYGLIAYASSLDQIGPLANDVYGATLLLECIAGHDPRDSTSLNIETPAWTSTRWINRSKACGSESQTSILRKVLTLTLNIACVRRWTCSNLPVRLLHSVSLPHSKYAVATYYLIACSEASSNLARFDGIHYGHRADRFDDLVDLYCQSRGEGFGAEVKRRIMLGTYALSAGYYDAYYLKALKVRRLIADDFAAAFRTVDVIAGPVAPTPAFRLGEKLEDPLAMYLNDIYTISTNLAGLPGISVPCGLTAGNLPVGLQLQAPALDEARLLQVAHQFQQLTAWHQATV